MQPCYVLSDNSGIAGQLTGIWGLTTALHHHFRTKDNFLWNVWELGSCSGWSGWFNGQQKRQQVWIWLYSYCWAQTNFEIKDYCSWCAGYCNSQCFDFILCNFNSVVIFPVSDVSHLCSWSIAKFSSDKALQAFSSHSTQVVGRSAFCIKVVHLWSWKRSVSLWASSCRMRFHWTGSSD